MELLNERAESFEEFNPELVERQRRIVDTIGLARESGVESGYLSMATGTGKTHVAAQDVRAFLQERPNARVLYLCHRTEILRQAQETFTETLPEHVTHGQLYSGNIEDQAQVVYAGFQQMRSRFADGQLYEGFQPDDFDYVIVDESHHGPAETYRPIIEYFRPVFLLGLTATPERRDRQDIAEIFGPELHALHLEEAIARGYLSKVDYRVLTDYLRRLGRLETEAGTLTLDQINRKLFVPKREEEIVAEVHHHLEDVKDPHVVVFCSNVEAAERMADLMPQPAATVHHRVRTPEEAERMRDFRNGRLRTLTVIDKLNEGVDLPEANVIVFLRSTESKTVYFQQLGRGLRNIPGKSEVLVLDFVATWERIEMVTELLREAKRRLEQRPSPRPVDVPFSFDFSEEAMDVVQLVHKVREIGRPRPPAQPPRRQVREAAIRRMLGMDALPDQRISDSEWRQYASRIARGDEAAKTEFFWRRVQIVWRIAESVPYDDAASLEDRFQSGCEALLEMMSIHLANPDVRKSRLNLEAAIRNRMMKARRYPEKNFWIPVHVQERSKKIEKAAAKLRNELGREPVPEEISEVTGIDPEKVLEAQQDTSPVRQLGASLADIDRSLHDQERGTVQEFSTSPDSVHEAVTEEITSAQLMEVVSELRSIERKVLALRFGLGGLQPQTLDDAGKIINATRERVRQIENSALRELAGLREAASLRSRPDGEDRRPMVTEYDGRTTPGIRQLALRLGYSYRLMVPKEVSRYGRTSWEWVPKYWKPIRPS